MSENNQEVKTIIKDSLQLFETNKDDRQLLVDYLLKEIMDGNINALTTHLQIKSIEDFTETIKKDEGYKEEVLKEARKYLNGRKSETFHNSKIEISEVGTQYNFTNCNDPEYTKLLNAAFIANEALKVKQDFLKKIPKEGFEIVDKTSGEIVTIYPPSKTSTTALKVTLK